MRMGCGRMMFFEEGWTPVSLPIDEGLCRWDGACVNAKGEWECHGVVRCKDAKGQPNCASLLE